MIVKRVEKHRIGKNHPLYAKADALCFNAKNVYNQATYLIRQEYIRTKKAHEENENEQVTVLKASQLYHMINEEARGDMSARPFNILLREIDDIWKGFFKSCREYHKNSSKFTGRPKMPGYLDKENGRYVFTVDDQKRGKSITEKDGYIRFALKDMQDFNGIFKTHIQEYNRICQARIVPKNGYYDFELVFDIEILDVEEKEPKRIAAIDLGVNNLATIVTNFGTVPIVINGKPLKSINHYYNKELARIKSELELRHGQRTSKRMQSLTNKRNAKVDDYLHKASKMIVDYLVENNVDTLVIGHNNGWKQEADMDKKNNQNFVQISHSRFIDMLTYKLESKGIRVVEVEEMYTSGTSFLDYEEPTKENYNKKRRITRGMFVSNEGVQINADANAAYQILVKVFPSAFLERNSVKRHPIVKNIDYIKKVS